MDTQPASEQTEHLPHLRQLETAKAGDYAYVPVMLIFGCMTLWVVPGTVFVLLKYRQFMTPVTTAASLTLIALCIWLVLRVLLGYYSFSTDPSGLTMRGLLRRRLIPWAEVRSLSIRSSVSRSTAIILDLHDGRVKFVPAEFGSCSSAVPVIASVWQYARQMGRAEGVKLPDIALRLWKPVPGDVPAEIDWSQPPQRLTKLGTWLVTAMLIVAAAFPLWAFGGKGVFGLLFAAPISVMSLVTLKMLRPEMMDVAWRVSVREGYLEADTARGKLCIPWPEITSAYHYGLQLRIRADGPRREVRIPFATGDRDSENLTLAIVRRLRENTGLAISLPVCVSREPDVLNRTAVSSQAQSALRTAYLNTLEEPVRRRLRRLYGRMLGGMAAAFVLGGVVAFSDILGLLSRLMHASGSRHFVTMETMYLGVPWMMTMIILSSVLGDAVCTRLAGPYKEQWRRLSSLGYSRKQSALLNRLAVVIIALTIAATILGLGCYARATDRGFAVNDFLGFGERFHTWSQVREVVVKRRQGTTRDGQTYSNYVYRVAFTDGSDWRFDESNVRCSRREELRKAVEFVAKRSNKPLVER